MFRVKEKKSLFHVFLSVLIVIMVLLLGCKHTEKESNRFIELLELFPESAVEDECFFLIDYEAIWKRSGIVFPNSPLNKSEIVDILLEQLFSDFRNQDQWIVEFSSFYTGWVFPEWQQKGVAPVQHKYVGYDIPNIAAEINNGVKEQCTPAFGSIENLSMPDLKVAAIGSFSPEETERALENQEEWPDWVVDCYQKERYHGVVIHDWTPDSVPPDFQGISPPHNLDGELPALAVKDNRLYVGESGEEVRQMMDADAGRSGTLADIPEYALLANGLTELGAYVAILGDGRLTNTDSGSFTDYPLHPFLTFGTGYGSDEKGYYVALVLVHKNEESANANVEILPKRFEEYRFSLGGEPFVEDIQVWSEGKVLKAKLYTEELTYWYCWLTWQTNTLFHYTE